jgi:hypothetical protein
MDMWWTRAQSIRTAACSQFEVALVETSELPAYQRIARKALHLRKLGLSARVIAVRLGVTDKTAAKAIRWLEFLDLLESSFLRDSSGSALRSIIARPSPRSA